MGKLFTKQSFVFKPVSLRYAAYLVAGILGMAMLSGCGSILSSDITPPADYNPQEASGTATPPSLPVRPLVLPDLAAGKAIFTEKCAACHGDRGMGDGPQAGKLSNPPAKIGSPQVARPARPVDWFTVVTQGRIDQMMPGFQSLSDRQRMDVVAYAVSLSSDANSLALAKPLYQEKCSPCHGENGRGDGLQAAKLNGRTPDWSDPVQLMRFSTQELYDAISQGKDEMHTFAGQLDENQRWALAGFVRSLARSKPQELQANVPALTQTSAGNSAGNSTAQTQTPAGNSAASATPAPTGEPAASGKVRLVGRLSNGSGGALPEKMEVVLAGFDEMQSAVDLRTTTDAAGNYAFEDVALVPGRMYLLSTRYNGIKFSSDLLKADDLRPGEEAHLPIVVYETSTDTSPLKIERMHVFLQFGHTPTGGATGSTPAQDVKLDRLQVVTLYIISNPTNKVIIPAVEGEPVLSYPLPYGATNLQFDEPMAGQRYVQLDGKIGDLKPIYPSPAQQQVLFAYDLPYKNALNIKLTQPLEVKAAVVALPVGNVSLSGDGLVDGGVKAVQNTQYQFYNHNNLPPGGSLDLNIQGNPAGETALLDPNTTNLAVGLGAFLLAVILFTVLILRSRRPSSPAAEEEEDEEIEEAEAAEDGPSEEEILDAIVTLDDMYRAGKLPQQAYQQRRAELKLQLAKTKNHD